MSTKDTNNEVGTGLGLLLYKEWIERNKGKMWIESEKYWYYNLFYSTYSSVNG